MSADCDLRLVRSEVHESVRQFVHAAKASFGERLSAIAVFGDSTADWFDPRRHIIRTVVVEQREDLGAVLAFGRHGPAFAKRRFATPWILTPATLASSLDTFPLELMEVQLEGATVYGQDHFGALTFADAHVRLQCEREWKSALITLQSALLTCAGDARRIQTLTQDASPALDRTLMGLLWVHGIRKRRSPIERAHEAEKLCGSELGGIRRAISGIALQDLETFGQLYRDIERLAEYVNAQTIR